MLTLPPTTARANKSERSRSLHSMRSALERLHLGSVQETSASFVTDHVSQEKSNKHRHDEKQHNRNSGAITHAKIRDRLLEHEVSQDRRAPERTAVRHDLHEVKRTQSANNRDDDCDKGGRR